MPQKFSASSFFLAPFLSFELKRAKATGERNWNKTRHGNATHTKVQQSSAFALAQIGLQSDTLRAFVAANYLIKAARECWRLRKAYAMIKGRCVMPSR